MLIFKQISLTINKHSLAISQIRLGGKYGKET